MLSFFFHHPRLIAWYITPKCNLNCAMCFTREAPTSHQQDDELRLDAIRAIIKDISRAYRFCFSKPIFIISGGEPFMREDILEIFACLKENNFTYKIATNFLLPDNKNLDELARMNPPTLGVSLHHLPKNESNRLSEGYDFEKVINNIRIFREKNKKTELILCIPITKNTISGLSEVVPLAHAFGARININHLMFNEPMTYKNHLAETEDLFGCPIAPVSPYQAGLTDKDVEELLMALRKMYVEAWHYNIEIRCFPSLNVENIETYYSFAQQPIEALNCRAYNYEARITPQGLLYPCIKYIYGDLKKNTLPELWHSTQAERFRKKMKQNGPLPGCLHCGKLGSYASKKPYK